jgi:hypothetical protein
VRKGLIHEPARGVPFVAKCLRKHGEFRSPWDSLTGFVYEKEVRIVIQTANKGKVEVLWVILTADGKVGGHKGLPIAIE